MRVTTATTGLTLLAVLLLAGSRQADTCAVTLRLTDAATGREIPGLLKITDADGESILPPELLARGLGLNDERSIHDWSVLPEERTVTLPRTKLTVEAISGLETEAARITLDLTGRAQAELTLPLLRFHDAAAAGFRSGNTHLHLMKLSRDECDRYLQEIPRADDLDALFVSYLERTVADKEYTSNGYTRDDLAEIRKRSGIVFGNGEEHRHNFTGFGQGFGHVMLLNITRLVQPVSIGPGIMKMGTDGIPLQRGIDAARRDGATVIWCHNAWGMEDLPNLVTGRLDAQNIFDGGTHGSYKDSYYRSLEAGLPVPFSTGTDWFMYDFSRVYVDMRGDLTVRRWLDSLAEGRSYVSNGPLLQFRVDGEGLGETVEVATPRTVAIDAKATGRVDFERLELVRNGTVIRTAETKKVGGHHEAELSFELAIDEPCWLALRTPPPPVKDDPELQTPVPKNEFGRDLFAHTSAIHVEVGGRSRFDERTARGLLAEMRTHRGEIAEKALFADAQERSRVLDVYDDGIAAMQEHVKRYTSGE